MLRVKEKKLHCLDVCDKKYYKKYINIERNYGKLVYFTICKTK